MLIMQEGHETSDEFQRARALLQEAELICFLGFGYLETNLERLFGRDPESGALRVPQRSYVCGSAYGIRKAQQAQVVGLMNQPGERQYDRDPETGVATVLGYPLLGLSEEKSLEFLQEHVIFPVGLSRPSVIP